MWPRGVHEVKAPTCLDTRHMKVVGSSPLRTGRLYLKENPGTHFLEAKSTPGTWTCRMLRKKSPVTRPGIDPGTVRLIALRLNHYVTPHKPSTILYFSLLLPLSCVQISLTLHCSQKTFADVLLRSCL